MTPYLCLLIKCRFLGTPGPLCAGPIGMGEALFGVFRPREDDGAYRESICGTWHMPIGTLLIFSLFANNVRTAGPIGMGEALIGSSTSGR